MRVIKIVPQGYEKYDKLNQTREGVQYNAYRKKTNHLALLVLKTILVVGLSGGLALCSKRVRRWVGQIRHHGDVVYKVANRALGVPSSISKEELYEIAEREESTYLPKVPRKAIDQLSRDDLIILGELFSELDTILEQDFGLPDEEIFSHQQFLENKEFEGQLLFIGVASSSLLLAPFVNESNGKWGVGRGNSARELSTFNDEQVSSLLLSYFMARFDRDVPYSIVVDREKQLPFSTRITIINCSLEAFGECQTMIEMDNCDEFIPIGFDFEALKAKVSALKLEERFLLNRVFEDINVLCQNKERTRDLLLKVAEDQSEKWPTESCIQLETNGLGSFSLSVACRSASTGGWKIGQYDEEITTLNATEINLLCILYTLSELEEFPFQRPTELIYDEEPFISGFNFPDL